MLANNLPGIALLAPYELDKGARLLIPGVKVNFDTYRFPFESQARPRDLLAVRLPLPPDPAPQQIPRGPRHPQALRHARLSLPVGAA